MEQMVDDPQDPSDPQNPIPTSTRERFFEAYSKVLQGLNQPRALRPEFQTFTAEVWTLMRVIAGYYEAAGNQQARQRLRHTATQETEQKVPRKQRCTAQNKTKLNNTSGSTL